jgi:hypothetical protein
MAFLHFCHSKPVHYGLILVLAATLAAVSCDRPDGPDFPGLYAVAPDQARVYLYRRSALAAYAQGFEVRIDGKPLGTLANASYLTLALKPGQHELQVAPGGMAGVIGAHIDVKPGKAVFYEFVFPAGFAMRPSFREALLAPRDEAEALIAMRQLREKQPFLVQDHK